MVFFGIQFKRVKSGLKFESLLFLMKDCAKAASLMSAGDEYTMSLSLRCVMVCYSYN